MPASLNNVYIGNRYIPLYAGQWVQSQEYEGLTYVQNDGKTYLSKRPVPPGTELSDETYWVMTGEGNAAIEKIQGQLDQHSTSINRLEGSVSALQQADTNHDQQIAALQQNDSQQGGQLTELNQWKTELQQKIDDGEIAGGAWTLATSIGIKPGTDISDQLLNLDPSVKNLAFPAGEYTISKYVTVNIPCYFVPGAIISTTGANITFNQEVFAGNYQIFKPSDSYSPQLQKNTDIWADWYGWVPGTQPTAQILTRIYRKTVHFNSGNYGTISNLDPLGTMHFIGWPSGGTQINFNASIGPVTTFENITFGNSTITRTSNANLTLINCNIIQDIAFLGGGSAYLASVTVKNCSIIYNHTNTLFYSTNISIIDSTITANKLSDTNILLWTTTLNIENTNIQTSGLLSNNTDGTTTGSVKKSSIEMSYTQGILTFIGCTIIISKYYGCTGTFINCNISALEYRLFRANSAKPLTFIGCKLTSTTLTTITGLFIDTDFSDLKSSLTDVSNMWCIRCNNQPSGAKSAQFA